MDRLSLSALSARSGSGGRVPASVELPRFDPRGLDVGLVHFGVGAFHRAHQAAYTQRACEVTGDDRWGTFAVTGRSATVVEQLRPQDGLYGVLTKGADLTALHVVGVLREVVCGAGDPGRTLVRMADPRVSVTTLTITEKGYPRSPEGHLAQGTEAVTVDIGAVRAVVDGGRIPDRTGSSVGLLTAGLAARFHAGAEPINVVSCDNLPGNGAQLGRLVHELADAAGSVDFSRWLQQCVTFPSTMVDRIVPATTDRDRAEAAELLRLHDAGLVVAEPFGQWVIQDRFAADRPAWERAGATLAPEVEPYETAKLRMLNGTHSLLAYLGALRGHETIAAAVGDGSLHDAARALQREDAIPTLDAPPGLDLTAYGDEILERYRNPHLRHTTVQVAMDGSQKLPIRLLDTARDHLRAGTSPQWCARAVAAWMVYVYRGHDVHGRDLPLNDPLAPILRKTADGPESSLVDRMLAARQVFDLEIAADDGFRSAVRAAASELLAALP